MATFYLCRAQHPHLSQALALACTGAPLPPAPRTSHRSRKRKVQRPIDPSRSWAEGGRMFLAGATIPSLNETNGWHWRRYKAEKERWEALVALWAPGMARIAPGARVRVRITVRFPDGGRHDWDNYNPKALMDGLVKSGVLIDDDCQIVTEGTIRCEVRCPPDAVGTFVEILPA